MIHRNIKITAVSLNAPLHNLQKALFELLQHLLSTVRRNALEVT